MLRHAYGCIRDETTVYGMVYYYGLPYRLPYMVYYRKWGQYLIVSEAKSRVGDPFSSLIIFSVL